MRKSHHMAIGEKCLGRQNVSEVLWPLKREKGEIETEEDAYIIDVYK